jgi:hypothetical protein
MLDYTPRICNNYHEPDYTYLLLLDSWTAFLALIGPLIGPYLAAHRLIRYPKMSKLHLAVGGRSVLRTQDTAKGPPFGQNQYSAAFHPP